MVSRRWRNLRQIAGSRLYNFRVSMRTRQSTAGSQPESFEGLYQRSVDFVWRRLRRLGVGTAAVEDAVQDVFLAAHARLPSFEWSPVTRAWLAQAAAHVASNHRRRFGR